MIVGQNQISEFDGLFDRVDPALSDYSPWVTSDTTDIQTLSQHIKEDNSGVLDISSDVIIQHAQTQLNNFKDRSTARLAYLFKNGDAILGRIKKSPRPQKKDVRREIREYARMSRNELLGLYNGESGIQPSV